MSRVLVHDKYLFIVQLHVCDLILSCRAKCVSSYNSTFPVTMLS